MPMNRGACQAAAHQAGHRSRGFQGFVHDGSVAQLARAAALPRPGRDDCVFSGDESVPGRQTRNPSRRLDGASDRHFTQEIRHEPFHPPRLGLVAATGAGLFAAAARAAPAPTATASPDAGPAIVVRFAI